MGSVSFVKKLRAGQEADNWKEPQSMEIPIINKKHNRNYDYENFLNELNSINSSVKTKKGHSQMELNDRKGSKT